MIAGRPLYPPTPPFGHPLREGEFRSLRHGSAVARKHLHYDERVWSKKYPEYLKKIDEHGHEIGTHSATHPYMSKLNKEQIISELKSSSEAITSVTGKPVSVFRPPYGDYSDVVIETAKEMGLYSIQWSVDSLDWKNLSGAEIEARVIKGVKNGSIVLFHNQGLHTAEALSSIIRRLKADGFTFERIGDLIYKENYEMLPDGGQVEK